MKNIVIDTNAYTRLLKGEENVLDVIGTAEIVYMSIFVLGELYAGFAGGTKERANKDVLNIFLRKAGTPLPINDLWIAAHALETGSTLITYDSHFKKIAGLRRWDEL